MGPTGLIVWAFALVAAFLVIVLAIGWLAGRFGYPKVRLAVLLAGAGYLVYIAIDTLLVCGAEPEIVTLNDGAEYVRHACDGPLGFLSYVLAFAAAPLGTILLSFLAVRAWRNLKSSKGAAA